MLRPLREAALVCAALATHAAAQDDDELDRTPQDCIVVNRIDRTEVIDDNTILFHMRGNRVYVNHLPDRCPNLAREDRFTYRVQTSQICDTTTITVLERSSPLPGFTCRLGQFQPVTIAEVDEIRRVAEQGSRGDAIEVEEVEPPDDGEDGDEERAQDDN